MTADPWKHVNREHFPLVYVGPNTKWGLEHGTPLHVVRDAQGRPSSGRSGLRGYTDPTGEAWQLPPVYVVAFETPPSLAQRVKAKVGRGR